MKMNKCLVLSMSLLFASYSSLVWSTGATDKHTALEAADVDAVHTALEAAGISDPNNIIGAGLEDDNNCLQQCRNDATYFLTESYKAAANHGHRLYEGDSETWKATGVCCLATSLVTAAITCGILYAGHTTRVYNRTENMLTISYRPGCTKISYTTDSNGNKIKKTKEIDCHDYVNPNDHTKEDNLGQLTKLCAEKTNGYSSNSACTTYDALKNSYNWNVHEMGSGALEFTRGDGASVPTLAPTSSPSWSSTDSGYISDVAPITKSYEDSPNLRGSHNNVIINEK